MALEAKIEKAFTADLENLGGEIRKLKWIGRKGAPDRFACLRGWIAFIEFKAPGESLSPHQDREIKRLRAQDVTVLVISTFEEAQRVIDFLKRFPS